MSLTNKVCENVEISVEPAEQVPRYDISYEHTARRRQTINCLKIMKNPFSTKKIPQVKRGTSNFIRG